MTHAMTTARASKHLVREEGAPLREQQSGHVSVLTDEVLTALAPKAGEVVLDATVGQGGHSEAFLRACRSITLVALDADPAALAAAKERLARWHAQVHFVNGNFRDLSTILAHEGVRKLDKALFDLGWNSTQLSAGRGFSFAHNEPLIMSYGQEPASGFTAADILNTWSEEGIADALFGYGEERYARRIAKAVVARRATAPLRTTLELVELIADAVPKSYRHGRLHPATRSFQALRIAVNDELGSLQRGITAAWEHLSPHGRLAVISFHSIEDRAVKRLFSAFAKTQGKLVCKKPLLPSRTEMSRNPRARSAKLRVIEKN